MCITNTCYMKLERDVIEKAGVTESLYLEDGVVSYVCLTLL